MKKLILLTLIITGLTLAQSFKVEKIKGSAKFLNSNEQWVSVNEGIVLPDNSLLVSEDNSKVIITADGKKFTLNESSAIWISNIKQMTVDELLLALAMEDIMSAPRKKENSNGKSTAVYGEKEGSAESIIMTDDFGTKRIKGAIQLAENGYKESAIVSAKEIFRKYPETNKMAEYRIYFADLLYDFNLYEEAYKEFSSIKELKLSAEEKAETEKMLSLLNKKIVNK